jgi:guanylate kinase
VIARRGLCLVLAAPSGVGKSSLARALVAAEPQLSLSISATTRAPRPAEQDGAHYHFRDQAQFDAMAEAGDLLEWATVFGQSYGTPRAPVEAAIAAGRDVVFDIDWQGHRQLRAALPDDMIGVFLLPPSIAALNERLRGRRGDSEAEITRRMAAAATEMSHWAEFDHVLVNAEFEATVAALRAILTAGRLATRRQTGLACFVAGLVGA